MKITRFIRVFGWVLLGLAVLLGAAAAYLFWPVNPAPLISRPEPVDSYAAAVQDLQSIQSKEGQLNPLCQAKVLTHGEQVQKVVILVHGYTTCPYQFRQLAPQLYERGYNVLMLPLPHHGLSDRMNTEQGELTAEELAAYADQAVNLAHGFGREVYMLGFSAGATTTAWAAQHRPDLARVLVVSPTFGYKAVPPGLGLPFVRAYLLLNNSFTWWNPDKGEAGAPPYAYPRYATHSAAQAMRLGQLVLADAQREPLAASTLTVVTNANDGAVDNSQTAVVAAAWQKLNPGKVTTYEFPASLKLGHDIIDPAEPDSLPDVVYPQLIALLEAK